MSVNYKVGADVGSFKQGMQEAQASLRTLDAALKNNEASLKAGGNAQIYMEQKARLLNDKMQQQKKMADQLQDAMRKMAESGVSKASVEYQRLQQQLLQAQTGMNEASYALNHLTEAEEEAADGADQLTQSVNNIGKKISLEQVISGIGSITGAMESAAGKAVKLGETIWDNVMNSAKWADDTATMALMYEVPLERYLQVQKLVQSGLDTSVDAILKSQQKLKKNIGSGGDSFYQTLVDLGLAFVDVGKFGETSFSLITDDAEEMFWKAGKAIMALSDAYDKEAIAQEVFGKSWRELIPLFKEFSDKNAFDEALKNTKTNTEEEVEVLATMSDQVSEVMTNLETLGNIINASLAPALTDAANALNGLLESLIEYLRTPEGEAALKSMEESVRGLFEDLGKIDPESVVENFTNVFNKLIDGFKWLNENKDLVIGALEGIVAGWAGLKLTGGVLQVWQLISGLKGFVGSGVAGSGLAAVGNAAGGVAGSGGANFVNRVLTGGTGATAGAVTIATNGVALGDFLINNTRVGQGIRDTGDIFGSIARAWEEKVQEIKDNAATFMEDWENLIKETGAPASESSILGEPGQLFQEWEALFGGGEKVEVPAELDIDPEEAQDAASKITVQIGARIVPVSFSGGAGGGGGGKFGYLAFHANGIWDVPFDGYPAILHRGEQVVPAREVSSRSYNSNLYVEKMIMNNGTDAEGLASAMAAAQRRRMSGYGS